jgi:hypothetical protein
MARKQGSRNAGWSAAAAKDQLRSLLVHDTSKPERRNSRRSRAHRLEHGLTEGQIRSINEDASESLQRIRVHCKVLELTADAIQRGLSPEEAAEVLYQAASDLRKMVE